MAKQTYTAYSYCRPRTAVRPTVDGCTTHRGRLYDRPWAAVNVSSKEELNLPYQYQKAYLSVGKNPHYPIGGRRSMQHGRSESADSNKLQVHENRKFLSIYILILEIIINFAFVIPLLLKKQLLRREKEEKDNCMKQVKLFYQEKCPFCKKAFRYIEELKEEYPELRPIEIEMIEETQHPDIADQYDYYYVPTFYMDGVKMHEAGIFKHEMEALLRKAIE